jgi:hypothetical protein
MNLRYLVEADRPTLCQQGASDADPKPFRSLDARFTLLAEPGSEWELRLPDER